jgi:thiamine transport system permease protein
VLGGPSRNTIESDIALRAFGIGDIPAATVLALTQGLLMMAAFLMFRLIGGRSIALATTAVPRLSSLPRRLWPWAGLIAVSTSVFVIAPITAVVMKSFVVGEQVSLEAWRLVLSGNVGDSVWSSLRVASLAGPVAVVLACAATLTIVRLPSVGRALDGLSVLPLAISPVTLGLGLVVTFDNDWYDWRSEWWFVAIAHTLVAFPLAVRVLIPAWRSVPSRLHDAAATLGAGETRRLFDIDLRLVHRALIGSLGIVIAVSVGEFGAASLLSRRGTETMPVIIARLLTRTGDIVRAQAFVLSTLLIVVCLCALVLVEVSLGGQSRAASH